MWHFRELSQILPEASDSDPTPQHPAQKTRRQLYIIVIIRRLVLWHDVTAVCSIWAKGELPASWLHNWT